MMLKLIDIAHEDGEQELENANWNTYYWAKNTGEEFQFGNRIFCFGNEQYKLFKFIAN